MPEKKNKEQKKIRRTVERLVSPENIDQMLTLVQPKRWMLLASVLIILTSVLVWAFVGRIPTEIEGRAVALNPKGVFSIETKARGTLSEIFVTEGDFIDEGDAIAKIYDPQRKAILTGIVAMRYKIQKLKVELTMFEERLQAREKLFEEGLIPKTVVEDSKVAVIEKQIALEESKASLISLYTDLEKTASSEEIDEALKRMLTREFDFEVTAEQIENLLSVVYAPSQGRILEVLVNVGDIVEVKKPLFWIERAHSPDDPIIFFGSVPIEAQDRIDLGMRVQIEPTNVNPQEYGAMIGEVAEVFNYVVSEEELLNSLHHQQLVNYLKGTDFAVIKVIVKPLHDSTTESGYAWTSKKGPPFRIPSGTLAKIKVIIEEQPPISYLIPLWKIQ